MYLPLELVLNVVTQLLPKRTNVILQPSHPITQTLLAFTLVCRATRTLATRYLLQYCVHISSHEQMDLLVRELSTKLELRKIPAMLFTGFNTRPGDYVKWQVAKSIIGLVKSTAPFLKRLVVDITFRLYGVNDENSLDERALLYQLVNLEEFASTGRLESMVHRPPPLPWKRCTKLKRLALYGLPRFSEVGFWENIASLQSLETLVLTRAEAWRVEISNIKHNYFAHTNRPLKVLLINVEKDQVQVKRMQREGWDIVDPQQKMTIMRHNVPLLYDDEDLGEACRAYVKAGAENGTLWDWEGDIVPHVEKRVRTKVDNPSDRRLRGSDLGTP